MTSGWIIRSALDYLTASNRKSLGDDVAEFDSGMLNAEGKNVVVIGGGDTAMDCVRTAIRQEAKSVTCLYHRDRANMPGSQREVENAEEEGVNFQWLSAPHALLGDETVGAVRERNQAPEKHNHCTYYRKRFAQRTKLLKFEKTLHFCWRPLCNE